MSTTIYDHCTKIGIVRITCEQKYLIGIDILNTKKIEKYGNKDGFIVEVIKQIDAYLLGELKIFEIPFILKGTIFQKTVWQYLQNISYGEVLSYASIAKIVKSSPRAIGKACAANPITIVVPCHRVISSNGRLTGYSGGDGIRTKQFLLSHEQFNNNPK